MTDRSRSIARLQFLGGQKIEIGSDVVTPEAERLFAMVVRLCVPLGRLVSRQTVMDTLWPGADEVNARHNLRQTVYKARELGLVVESGEDGLRLDPQQWSCDWEDPVGDVLGEWLPDYDPLFSEDLRGWVSAQRAGVHASLRPRIVKSLQRARSAGELAAADAYARQLLSIDELNEEATLTRAELMALRGSKVDALRLLDAYLAEVGTISLGREAAIPAHMLRRRIAEKLPVVAYASSGVHHGDFVGRTAQHQQLCAAIFEARAGRGRAFHLRGSTGSGKSRLLHEAKKLAILQGMLVLSIQQSSAALARPYHLLREMTRGLLDLPGALGITPEALASIRSWLESTTTSVRGCPIAEVEDLLAAISEETPLLVQIEASGAFDTESAKALTKIYRREQPRYHTICLASSMLDRGKSAGSSFSTAVSVSLLPMSTNEIIEIVTAYAQADQPSATHDQIVCAAVFAEGVPMYGIEMLGLMLDPGSPDTIPWRVQMSIEEILDALPETAVRLLSLCSHMGDRARQSCLVATLSGDGNNAGASVHALETLGFLTSEVDGLRASSLLMTAARRRTKASTARLDCAKAAQMLVDEWNQAGYVSDFYSAVRLFISAREETRATQLIDAGIGAVIRKQSAQEILHEFGIIRRTADSRDLKSLLDTICAQIRTGTESKRQVVSSDHVRRPTSLPYVSQASTEVQYTLSTLSSFNGALHGSRDPNAPPSARLAEAVMALFFAANLGSDKLLRTAIQSVDALRDSSIVSSFDLCRADLIYFASTGQRDEAIRVAAELARESRIVTDVQLACKGLRNAAEAYSTFGEIGSAQSLLLESRTLASELHYYAQAAWADIRLADLARERMDIEGASAYLVSASALIDRHALAIPLLIADLHYERCWESVVRGDLTRAAKSARLVTKHLSGSSGTAHWTVLAARLASVRSPSESEIARDTDTLKASIGSRPFYPNEMESLAALALASRGTARGAEIREFAMSQFPRIEATGRAIWPFLSTTVAS